MNNSQLRAPTSLTCPTCGVEFAKDYWFARQITKNDYEHYYLWMCTYCGQEILEKKKRAVYL